MNIDNMKKIIESALEIQQKNHEIGQLLKQFTRLMTYDELVNRKFDNSMCNDALKLIEGLSLDPMEHVKIAANYKDIQIYLHTDIACRIVKNILEPISNSVIKKSLENF